MSISGRIRRHTWRRVLTGPFVMLFGAASVAGTAAVAMTGWDMSQLAYIPGTALAIGLTGVALFGRYVSKRKRFHREALDAAKREIHSDGQTQLAVLREYLMLTGDRVLTKEADALLRVDRRIEKLKDPANPVNADPGTLSTLAQLRDAAVRLLIKIAQLQDQSSEVVLPAAKQRLEQLRQDLLTSARESIRRLDETLDQLQLSTFTQDARKADETASLKTDLDQQLELARRIDERLERFDHEISTNAIERTP